MKAIIYCRVSTENQAERGYSLVAQEKDCRKYALEHGYEVDRVFIERGESAKTRDRTQLIELSKYACKNKGKLDALIVWQVDRLTRDSLDYHIILETFKKLEIKILFVTQNNDETPEGDFLRTLLAALAALDNKQRAQKTRRGMVEAAKSGRWCWGAPPGYENFRDESGKAYIRPSEEALFIKKIFEYAESGLYKLSEIVQKIRRDGFKRASLNLVNRILRNPLYAGVITSKKFFPNESYPGLHTPLVSTELFRKVQDILDRKKPTATPKNINHPDFPLRAFVKCPECSKRLTGSWSKGRNKKYGYYHCHGKSSHANIKKDVLDSNFCTFLKTLTPNKKTVQLFEAVVVDVWQTKKKSKGLEKNKLSDELEQLKATQKLVLNKLLHGTIKDETYKQKNQELEDEIRLKEIYLREAEIAIDDVKDYLKRCKEFVLNVADEWPKANVNDKQRFQQIVFPEGVTYKMNGSFGTTSISFIFNTLHQSGNDKSNLVAPTGVEPVSLP